MNQLKNIEFVVNNSKYVHINQEKVKSLASELTIDHIEHLQKELSKRLTKNQMIVFMLLCESINFCFWPEKSWKIRYRNKIYYGSVAMFLSMQRVIEEDNNIFDIENLRNITYNDFCNIFQTLDKPIPLLRKRYKNFKEVSSILQKKGKKFFYEIYCIESDVELLNYIVKTFPCFNDVSYFRLRKIEFYKRATLLVRDYYILIPKIRNNIKSISNLIACADYVVPKLLREFGILEYSKYLSKRVDSKKVLRHNSRMEVEIRSNMVYAVEMLKKELLKNTKPIDSAILDSILWQYGEHNKKSTPHHRTITTFY